MTADADRPAPQTAVDAFIAELRADGAVEGTASERGEFTLERSVAREKLRRFQLAEPRHYVLPLVQAAVLKGASWIDFRIDANDMRMQFDGRPFTTADFDGLYNALLRHADLEDRDLRALQELALGANAALALGPRYLRIVSGAGDEALQLELRPAGEDRMEACTAPTPHGTLGAGGQDWPPPTTAVHVRDKFSLRVLGRAVRNVTGALPEEQALAARCSYAPIPIARDGEHLSGGLSLPPALASRELQGDGFHGLVGLLPDERPTAVLRLVTHGVLVTTHELPEAPEGCVAIVSGDRLRKDVSQADVVQDDAYAELVDAVQRVWAELAALHDRISGPHRRWARRHLAETFGARRSLADYRRPDADPLGARLHTLRLWPVDAQLPGGALPESDADRELGLLAVAGAGPGEDVFVGGHRGNLMRLNPRREAWEPEEFRGDASIRALWAEDRDTVFAFGDDGAPYRRREGHWTLMPVKDAQGNPKVGAAPLRAASGSSPRRIYAVGERGRLLRRAGNHWREETIPTQATLHGITARGTSDLFVVGDHGLILRLDGGRQWRTIDPPTQACLRAVCSRAFDDVVAVGDEGTVVQFDGRRWRERQTPTNRTLHGVWITEGGEAWAVGDGGTLLQRGPDRWVLVESPSSVDLRAVYGADRDGFYAVGVNGIILHRRSRRPGGAPRWRIEQRPVSNADVSLEELASWVERDVTLGFAEGDPGPRERAAAGTIRLHLRDDSYRTLFTELFGLARSGEQTGG